MANGFEELQKNKQSKYKRKKGLNMLENQKVECVWRKVSGSKNNMGLKLEI